MKSTLFCSIIITMSVVSSIQSQDMDYYLPVGFVNPPLRSGHFLTSIFYFNQYTTITQEGLKTDTPKREISLIGYLGLTDYLTLQTNVTLIPDQTIYKLHHPQAGKDKLEFNIRPQFKLSYRPVSNFEIFGDLYFTDHTTEFGEKSRLQDVVVGIDPISGDPIIEKTLITQPALPSLQSQSTVVRFGFTYLGTFW